MSKEVQMTFRVEAELRAEFADAASLDNRPAAQVLREFMRVYVTQARQRLHAPANDVISAAERRRREKAAEFALASVRLEGFEPSPEALERMQRHANGEISLTDVVPVKVDARAR